GEHRGRAEGLVEVAAARRAAAPLAEGAVGPQDAQVQIDNGDAVAQCVEDLAGLEEVLGVLAVGRAGEVNEDALGVGGEGGGQRWRWAGREAGSEPATRSKASAPPRRTSAVDD